ncbi:MAG: hypothetical protein B7X89_12060 [Sulfuricurvum sp. 17-40-25]|nr:MAG: hypothetical protein B7X89_12060 [Sulfuricurvum sp. 17-40-25]
MDSKVANRYVKILTFIINTKVRMGGREVTFDRNEIFAYTEDLTDKTFKQMIEWFSERHIFEKVGNTFAMRYKLHPDFKFKLSKSDDTIKKQCQFIIGQLAVFSDKFWGIAEGVYAEVIMDTTLFDFMPNIKEQIVKDTLSTLMIAEYNDVNEGVYPYEVLQRLMQLKSTFDIKIKNSSLSTSMKSVTLKSIRFNTESITLQFNDATLNIDDICQIKGVSIPMKKDIRDKIDQSLDILSKYETDKIEPMIQLMKAFQIKQDLFFQ